MNRYFILKEARKEKGYSQEVVATLLKSEYNISIDKSNIGRYEMGRVKKPDTKILKALCELYDINYIDFYKELGLIDEKVENINNTVQIEVLEIPVYGKASAGNGYLNMERVVKYKKLLMFSGEKLPENIFGIEISGDSMYPTLLDGDLGIIDPNCESYDLNNKVCVITYDGETFIKRVRFLGEMIILMSDNPDRVKYKDIIIKSNDECSFTCNGVLVERRTKFVG